MAVRFFLPYTGSVTLLLRHKTKEGFTLIELMIVVSIIGILASVALPKFAEMIRKAHEGATKGGLGSMRSALNIYYADMEGQFPSDTLASLTLNGKYLSLIPDAQVVPYHQTRNLVGTGYTPAAPCFPAPCTPLPGACGGIQEGGAWAYVNCPGFSPIGTLYVDCVQTDSKGTSWSTY